MSLPQQNETRPGDEEDRHDKSHVGINRHGDIRIHADGMAHWNFMSTSKRRTNNSVCLGPMRSELG